MQAAARDIPNQDSVWERHYAVPNGYRYWPNEALVAAFSGRRYGTVLEAGCGNGANLWFLAEQADQVIGLDGCQAALQAALAYMRQRGCDDRVRLQQGSVFQLPVGDGATDAVVDVMTSQHVPWADYGRLFAEYRRALRTGGKLFLHNLGRGTTTTGGRRIADFTYDTLGLFPGVGPFTLPQAPALHAALGTHGFTVAVQRQSTRSYRDGSVATYITTEARAI